MQLELLLQSLLNTGSVQGATRMKSGLMSEIRSVGLALAVISSLVQPAHAATPTTELSSIDRQKSHSTSAAQLLVQNSDVAAKVTGVKINSTDKGIEVILETANAEALKPVSNNQGNSFIADIPNAVLALPEGGNFTQNNPSPGIVSVSVTQTNTNTLRLTVIGEGGLPNTELFDGDEGLIFAVTPVASATQAPQPTPSASQTITEVTAIQLNPTNNGLEIILATPDGEKLQVSPKSENNTYIADIQTAQLRLSTGNTFRQAQPIAGVSEVTVSNFDANTVRVSVIGVDTIPKVELFDSDRGLIFGIAQTLTQPTQPEQPSASDEPIELTATGEQDGYRAQESSTATKIDVPLRDIPASVQVVPKEVIQDRQVVRLNELADNVSGVRSLETYGGLASQGYFIRGFATGFETLRDGFKDSGFISPRDVSSIERVEFLKGPASVLYGSASSPGGVVNTITKQPLLDPFYQINGTIGSYDFYRTSIDLTGPLLENRSALYRLNAAYENAGSFRDFVNNESTYIGPIITFKAGDNTNISLGYEYQKYDYTFDRGLPNNNRVVFDLPISRFLGEPNLNRGEFTSNNFTYVLESKFGHNNDWKFRQGFNIINVSGSAGGVQPNSINDDGITVSRTYRVSNDEQENISFQNEISGKFNTGSIRHNILVGLELSNYRYQYDFYRGTISDLDIFNPIYGAQPESVSRAFFEEYGGDNIALYFQNLVEITPNLKLLAGGRFDWVDSFYRDLETGTTYNETSDFEFSPRVGIVYQPTDSTSIYASWTNSFNPQIFGRNRNNEAFQPETAEQFEVGIKQEFFGNRLSATLAYFDITKKNVLTTDPIDPDFSIQTGEQKSSGVELDIVGELIPGWKIIGTYTYTDAYVSQDNNPSLVNNRLVGVPYHSASLWTTYELQKGNLQGLGLGLGLVYVGERESDLPNNIEIPSYLRTDASIFYKKENWRAALNFKNVFDTKYYESQNFYIVPAAPFTVLGTISFEF
ncbi:TonB-dependent siderophore receptor [Calothrix sp. NIES-2098]|uniref:TonB-dependent siderophore receptor n=1 Tax=Calothrix sp. NIES-2098 TaxID=1954171 RepID=UPI000B5E7CED|nr:ferrichrome-iron receptor [Calothrix sp. NIES-2098]